MCEKKLKSEMFSLCGRHVFAMALAGVMYLIHSVASDAELALVDAGGEDREYSGGLNGSLSFSCSLRILAGV
jgi:hypothetical protein